MTCLLHCEGYTKKTPSIKYSTLQYSAWLIAHTSYYPIYCYCYFCCCRDCLWLKTNNYSAIYLFSIGKRDLIIGCTMPEIWPWHTITPLIVAVSPPMYHTIKEDLCYCKCVGCFCLLVCNETAQVSPALSVAWKRQSKQNLRILSARCPFQTSPCQ